MFPTTATSGKLLEGEVKLQIPHSGMFRPRLWSCRLRPLFAENSGIRNDTRIYMTALLAVFSILTVFVCRLLNYYNSCSIIAVHTPYTSHGYVSSLCTYLYFSLLSLKTPPIQGVRVWNYNVYVDIYTHKMFGIPTTLCNIPYEILLTLACI